MSQNSIRNKSIPIVLIVMAYQQIKYDFSCYNGDGFLERKNVCMYQLLFCALTPIHPSICHSLGDKNEV